MPTPEIKWRKCNLHRSLASFPQLPCSMPQPQPSTHSGPICPVAWLHTSMRAGMAEGGAQGGDRWSWLGPGMASEWGRDSHYWCLLRQHVRSTTNLCLWPDHHSLHPNQAECLHQSFLSFCCPLGQNKLKRRELTSSLFFQT